MREVEVMMLMRIENEQNPPTFISFIAMAIAEFQRCSPPLEVGNDNIVETEDRCLRLGA